MICNIQLRKWIRFDNYVIKLLFNYIHNISIFLHVYVYIHCNYVYITNFIVYAFQYYVNLCVCRVCMYMS